jgi:pyruvate dehydrogenase E1 component alpha subunit
MTRPELLQAMFLDMLRIRLVEEAIADRYSDQEMRCPVHLSIGQEAVAVGVCRALRASDKLFSTHRSHAHYLAKGGDLGRMLAEIYGKAAGCIGGRGGSMHLMDPAVGMMASIPLVASSIPIAVGSAFADQRTGADHVTVSFLGDACVEEGVFHESANFAVLRGLPVVFVCENNLYSVYTHMRERQPPRPITDLAEAHGMRAAAGDGNDVVAVHDLMRDAVERARNGEPSFLLFDTYRWREHCGPGFDNHIGYRSEEEYCQWREHCPIDRHRRLLANSGQPGVLDEQAALAEMKREIDAAFEFAKAAPLPDADQAGLHVYA